MDYYISELNRYLKNNKDKFDNKVLDYGKLFIKKIKKNEPLKVFLKSNSIGVYSLLSELIPLSDNKLKNLGAEILDDDEINKVISTVIINNEFFKLILNDYALIAGINSYNEFVYELTDYAIDYFHDKYGILLNKMFSMRDILILNIIDDEKNDIFYSLN